MDGAHRATDGQPEDDPKLLQHTASNARGRTLYSSKVARDAETQSCRLTA